MASSLISFFNYMPWFLDEGLCIFFIYAWPGKDQSAAEDDFDLVRDKIKALGIWKSYVDGQLQYPDQKSSKELELMLVREHKEQNEISLAALMDELKKAEWKGRKGDGEEVFFTCIAISKVDETDTFSIRPTQVLKNNTEVALPTDQTAGDEMVAEGFSALRDALEQMICSWFDGATSFKIGCIEKAFGSGMCIAGRHIAKIYR